MDDRIYQEAQLRMLRARVQELEGRFGSNSIGALNAAPTRLYLRNEKTGEIRSVGLAGDNTLTSSRLTRAWR